MVITSRDDSVNGQRVFNICFGLECYTDGSNTKTNTGAGIHKLGPCSEISVPMGEFPTMVPAELKVITECVRAVLRHGL